MHFMRKKNETTDHTHVLLQRYKTTFFFRNENFKISMISFIISENHLS